MSGGAGEGRWGTAPQPTMAVVAPPGAEREDYHWSSFDDSVNAVSFGFVATAILISMFLLMAIFEKFLRARSDAASPANDRRTRLDVESQVVLADCKLDHSPPNKASIYAKEVSVLMPGDEIPTFIAHPAAAPPPPPPPPLLPPSCPPERIQWPPHQTNHLQIPMTSLTRPFDSC